MSTAYFGFICRCCQVAYPLGLDTHRDLKYMLDHGPFALHCIRCGVTELYDGVTLWESSEAYSPALMGVSRERVHRVSKKKP